jgi:hypothetical protein
VTKVVGMEGLSELKVNNGLCKSVANQVQQAQDSKIQIFQRPQNSIEEKNEHFYREPRPSFIADS